MAPGTLPTFSLPKVLNDSLTYFAEFEAETHEYLGADALSFPNETEEDVLRTDVVVPELVSTP